jgi:secreted PhoX family phosphatase
MQGLGVAAAAALMAPLAPAVITTPVSAASADEGTTLGFRELAHGRSETHAVAEGYRAQTLIRWGDPVEPGAPPFAPLQQTAEAQARQWGYNNDFIGYMPLPPGSQSADHGLLCVNFEFTIASLMFPGVQPGDLAMITREQCEIEMAAHGHGIIEIRRSRDGEWSVVAGSPFNRRITLWRSLCRISGPAAGNPRLQTSADPTGMHVTGTLNNCAGGTTPWGTILSAEENFNTYFGGDPAKTSEARNYARYGMRGEPDYAWSRYFPRFDVEREPNEANRFGWVVEIDPYDPTSVPVKRTALGRFKHEGATTVVSADGRVVVYSGDDERFEYVYRFVSESRYDALDRQGNRDLLDRGTLAVARFEADGSLRWLPLVWGSGPLTPANGFSSQADVLIETRRAADLLGATPMDRPEDVETNPVTGIVYVALTNNIRREAAAATNPRGPNPHGHIIEMIPPMREAGGRDHAAYVYTWEVFLLAGDPDTAEDAARYHRAVSKNGWLSAPDNLTFDRRGRIWIATDGAWRTGIANGAYASDTSGPGRALTRHFYRTPVGAELCGPAFNSDDTAFFVSVQHPGATSGATFEAPATRWPDFQPGIPPRPAIQVIVRTEGGTIGS